MARKNMRAATVEKKVVVETISLPEKVTKTYHTEYYTFEYWDTGAGWYPVLKLKGEVQFSGWLCKDYDSAKSLLVSIYYQITGELRGAGMMLPIELVATHPLNSIIYPSEDGNVEYLRSAIETEGNLTKLHSPIVNPMGLVLSGNSRLKALEGIAEATGISQEMAVKITEEDELQMILSGNHQRQKSALTILRESEAIALRQGGARYKSRVMEIFQARSGLSRGYGEATAAVRDFLMEQGDSDVAESVEAIAESSATVAVEVIKLVEAEQKGELGEELAQMARVKKSAEPIDPERAYPGLAADVMKIREVYGSEGVPAIAKALMDADPLVRRQMVEAKLAGDKQKMSILRDALEAEDDAFVAGDRSQPKTDPYFAAMGEAGVHPAECWILNEQTANCLNRTIGGIADCDPFSEPTGNIQTQRRITAVENAFKVEHWGGGVHAPEKGIKIATFLPNKIVASCLMEIFKRIESEEVGTAVVVCDSSVLFLPALVGLFKALPLAYIPVTISVGGFGAEPSPYILSKPQFGKQTADNWNDRCGNYIILYHGKDYGAFEEECGHLGAIVLNDKAAKSRAVSWDWDQDSEGTLSTVADGILYEIVEFGDKYVLRVDGIPLSDKFLSTQKAQGAAIAHFFSM